MKKGPIYRSTTTRTTSSSTTGGSNSSLNAISDIITESSSSFDDGEEDVDIQQTSPQSAVYVPTFRKIFSSSSSSSTAIETTPQLSISQSLSSSSSSFKYLYSVNSISEPELEQDYQNERHAFLCESNCNDNNNKLDSSGNKENYLHVNNHGGGAAAAANRNDIQKLSYVQRMKQQFEVLATTTGDQSTNCQKCNWWIKSPNTGIVDNESFTNISKESSPIASTSPLLSPTPSTGDQSNNQEHVFQRHNRVIKKKPDWIQKRQSSSSTELYQSNQNMPPPPPDDKGVSIITESGVTIVKIKESFVRPTENTYNNQNRRQINKLKPIIILDSDLSHENNESTDDNVLESINVDGIVVVDDPIDDELIENEEVTAELSEENQLSDFEEANDHNQEDEEDFIAKEIIDTKNKIIITEASEQDDDDDDDAADHDDGDGFSDSFDSGSEDEDIKNKTNNSNKIQIASRPDSLASVSSNKLVNIIQELIENEETYIRSLTNGIEGYISIFNEKNLPNTLRGQKYSIFGNIERIKNFHEKEFYPAIQECAEDIEKIAQTFIKFIQEDYFYYYVLYAINRDKSERMCELNKEFFKDRQNTIGDKLGVNSFLVQPIQRLPKYYLLLNELIKELGKNLENSKEPIAACCIAQKNIQRLLDTVNESMSVNDVIECNDINIHHQGKFQKVSKFDIFDTMLRRKYQGKVFLFDKCVICTEILEEKKLHFRGYFPRDSTGFTFEDGRNKFILYVSKRGNQEIEFSSDFTTVQQFIKLLTNMLMKTIELEKQKIEEKRKLRHSTMDNGPVNVIVRINSPNSPNSKNSSSSGNHTNSSTGSLTPWTSGSSRESAISVTSINSTTSSSSRTSGSDSNRTTWYAKLVDDRRTSERLLNSEKYYINNLQKLTKLYLANLPQHITEQLDVFTKALDNILTFHFTHCYHALKRCHSNSGAIFDVFKDIIEMNKFDSYIKHAAYANHAKVILENHYMSDPETACLKTTIDNFITMPIRHIKNYNALIEIMIDECKVKDNLNDTVSEDFKNGAMIEVKLRQLRNRILENFNVNSMKDATSHCTAKDWGIVIYSDDVNVDGKACRILVLERALVCVKAKISSKTKEEKFIERVFLIPTSAVGVLIKKQYPKRLIILPSYARTRYVVDFTVANKKQKLLEHIPNVKSEYKN